MRIIIKDFLLPLLVTIILELLMLYWLKEKHKKIFILSILMNAFTNISLNLFIFVFSFKSPIQYFLMVFLIELGIWIFEGIMYHQFLHDVKKSVKYSFFCNGFSFLMGYIMQFLFIFIG